jgi:hypothetical protein
LAAWSDTAKPPVSPLPSKNRWERDPIPYALETDWPVGAAGFEPPHSGIEIRQDSSLGAAGSEPLHLEIRSAELHVAPTGCRRRSGARFDAFDRLWFRTAKSGSFIEAAEIANDIVREDIMPQNQPFEIPQQLRELAERNVEQARTAYGQLMAAMAQATGMWTSAMPSNEMTSGFKVVRERAIQFAKQNAEACFAAASELANAKDIKDLLAIQSRSAQTQMQAYTLQAQELGRLMVEAAQSVQPRS